MSSDFNYRASVIIPVYNRGNSVHVAFESLLEQTLPFDCIQVIIVNDGSTDDSLEICKKLTEPYDNAVVLDKPNGGQSSARNLGLDYARGKYIFYLDDDDKLAPETIESVVSFFDTCYDEVDLVTYKICYYSNWKKSEALHFRYDFLTESGIYDLNEFPAALQTTVNVCVKNKFASNNKFDEKLGYMEDQAYNNEVLSQKLKIGFCAKGEYQYNRHLNSIVSVSTSAYYTFEKTIQYFEELFSKYNFVPAYLQCSYLYNLGYRMRDNTLFPYHYNDEDFSAAMARISNLLEKVDERVLFRHAPIDDFYKVYFLTLKANSEAVAEFKPEAQTLRLADELLLKRESIILSAARFTFTGKKLRIIGYLKTPFFVFAGKPRAYLRFSDRKECVELDLYQSSYSYYNCEHKCAENWSFDITLDLDSTVDFKFFCEVNGIEYPCECEIANLVKLNQNSSEFISMKNNTRLRVKSSVFYIEKLSAASYKILDAKRMVQLSFSKPKEGLTYLLVKYLKKDRIWLYNDDMFTSKDNGYYQFKHDFNKKDGIKRYYVVDGNLSAMKGFFTPEEEKYLIPFGSRKHMLLYLAAEKILTSFCEDYAFVPMIPHHLKVFFDLIDSEVIYLQHGVLYAAAPTKYSRDRLCADKMVVSSHFELKNLVENYGYRPDDLIPTGMARYDYTDFNREPKKKILYAPSWRDKLVGKYVNRKREFDDNVLNRSTYYRGIVEFLTNPELLECLEKNDVTIEFKLHPNFVSYAHLFEPILNERVTMASADVELADYSLFITDFSSFKFDWIYHGKQLVYYVPDYDEFKCGAVTFYRDLDIDFKDGFGDFSKNAYEAVASVIKQIECNFETEEKYKNRIENFFISKGEHCEKLYQFLMNE